MDEACAKWNINNCTDGLRLNNSLLTVVSVRPGRLLLQFVMQEDQRSLMSALPRDSPDQIADGRFYSAQIKTAWGRLHQRRHTLTDRGDLLASAVQYDLTGAVDGRALRICGVGSVVGDSHPSLDHARTLVNNLLDQAARSGAEEGTVSDIEWTDEQLKGAGINKSKLMRLIKKIDAISEEMRGLKLQFYAANGEACLTHLSRSTHSGNAEPDYQAVISYMGTGWMDGGDW